LYVYERDASYPTGRIAFIASLPGADAVQGGRVSVWSGGFFLEDVTPDGRVLVFTSHGALTADAAGSRGAEQVFRYDASTGVLVRISVGEGGFNDNGNAGVGNARIVAAAAATPLGRLGSPRGDPTMSHDGSFVFFESPVALTPGAVDDVQLGTSSETHEPEYVQNVYEWHEGHVFLISDGRDVSTSKSVPCEEHHSSVCLLGTDATGRNVFFTTADPLVPEDGDTAIDVYDARVCTANEPCIAPAVAPASCQGEACHGTPGGAPGAVSATTAVFSGLGNLVPSNTQVVKPKARAKKPKAGKHKLRAKKHRAKKGRAGLRGRRSHKSSTGGK
jgi:hypothetical protein